MLVLLSSVMVIFLLISFCVAMIWLFVVGLLCLIICIVFAVLYIKGKKVPARSHKWERIVSIACGIVGVVFVSLSLGMLWWLL